MLAIGRALMAAPQVLLADELSLGLAPIIVKQVFAKLDEVRKAGITVLVVEQNARLAMKFADYLYVLKYGRVVMEGARENSNVRPRWSMPISVSERMHDYPLKQRTIGHLLADKARRVGDRTWLIFGEQRYSYAQAHDLSNRYANGFRALGIGKGDHVAVMLPNCPEFIWTIWGLAKLGAVAVPLNTAARGELLRYFITQSDSICGRRGRRMGGSHGRSAGRRPSRCGRSSRSVAPKRSLPTWPADLGRSRGLRQRVAEGAGPRRRCSRAIRNTSCTRRERPAPRRA